MPMAGETFPLPVRWVRFAYPPYENHTFPPSLQRRTRMRGVIAAALWPRAGIVKGAAASPLNTFARGKATESARTLANGTVHRAYIVALYASRLPDGQREKPGAGATFADGGCGFAYPPYGYAGFIRRVRLRLPALRLRGFYKAGAIRLTAAATLHPAHHYPVIPLTDWRKSWRLARVSLHPTLLNSF